MVHNQKVNNYSYEQEQSCFVDKCFLRIFHYSPIFYRATLNKNLCDKHNLACQRKNIAVLCKVAQEKEKMNKLNRYSGQVELHR